MSPEILQNLFDLEQYPLIAELTQRFQVHPLQKDIQLFSETFIFVFYDDPLCYRVSEKGC